MVPGITALVRSQAPPAMARIGRILDTRTGRPRWAAFLVSGETARDFPALLVFDVSSGRLRHRIVLDAAADFSDDGQLQADELAYGRGAVAGSRPAVVDANGNGLIDRVYVSSDKGLVYKIALPDRPEHLAAGISHCVLNTDFSAADGRVVPVNRRHRPVVGSPTVWTGDRVSGNVGPGERIWIFFGTGAVDRSGKGPPSQQDRNAIFAYTDAGGARGCDPQAHQLQWFVDLPAGRRMAASAFAAAGRIYFGTVGTTAVDPCTGSSEETAEEGGIAAVDLEGTIVFRRSIPPVLGSPMVEDNHLYVTLPGGTVSFGAGIYNNPRQSDRRLQVRIRAWQVLDP